MLTVLTSACSFVFCESLPLVTPLKGDLPEERAQDGPRVLPEWRRSGSCRLFVLYFAHLLAHLLTNTGYPLFGGHYSAPAGLQPGLGHRHPPPQSLRSRHCLSPRGSQRSFGNINQSGRVTLSHTSRGSGDLPAARRALCPLAWGPPLCTGRRLILPGTHQLMTCSSSSWGCSSLRAPLREAFPPFTLPPPISSTVLSAEPHLTPLLCSSRLSGL